MNEFYVYAWNRPCGTPFYIGKGKGYRATAEYGRNAYFKRIVAKIRTSGQEPYVELVKEGLSEAEAHDLERSLIAEYGRVQLGGILCNLTDGGEGNAGWVMPAEQRAKISAALMGRGAGVPHSKEHSARIGAAHKGKTVSEESLARGSATKRLSPPRSGYKGVYASINNWRAVAFIDGKLRSLGSYSTPEEAAKAYDRASIAAWGLGNCYLNFPQLYTN